MRCRWTWRGMRSRTWRRRSRSSWPSGCRSGSRTWWCRSGRRRAGSWRSSGTGCSPRRRWFTRGWTGGHCRPMRSRTTRRSSGENFDLKGLVEDMLQLDPETNHVVVILGATPLERYWTAEFQKAFEPFAGRVKFTWVNDLSFEQMLDLVSKLPPHSFVLLGLLHAGRVGGDVQRGRRAGAAARGFAGADQRPVPAPGGPGDRGGAAVPGGVGGRGVGARGGADPARRAGVEFPSAGDRDARADVRLARADALGDQRKPAAAGERRAVPSAHRVGTVPVARGRGGRGDRDAGRVDLRAACSSAAGGARRAGATQRASRSRSRSGHDWSTSHASPPSASSPRP